MALYCANKAAAPTFTGTKYEIVTIGNYMYMYLKDSGELTINADAEYDLFCVGGGSSGKRDGGVVGYGHGGGSGYTTTKTAQKLASGTKLTVIIGAGGVAHTSGNFSNAGSETSIGTLCVASGGLATTSLTTRFASDGGSGGGGGGYDYEDEDGTYSGAPGKGGSDGSDGSNGGGSGSTRAAGGEGQGTTTRAFAETTGTLYAGGGGGGCFVDGGSYAWRALGGDGGGGAGAGNGYAAVAGTANTGGGGGGGGGGKNPSAGGAGGSGLAIIRWKIA